MITENNENIISRLEGISIENVLNRETIKQLLKQSFSELISEYSGEIIIFPMDGGFFLYYEFIKYIQQNEIDFDISKIHFAVKSENPEGKRKYITSINEKVPQERYIIVDDIYDSGESEELIREALGSRNVRVRAISTKSSRNSTDKTFSQAIVFEDKWIMSSLGMNSGMFDGEIELRERVASIAIYIEDENKVKGWNNDQIESYIELLKSNSYYSSYEIFEMIRLLVRISKLRGFLKLSEMKDIHSSFTGVEH